MTIKRIFILLMLVSLLPQAFAVAAEPEGWHTSQLDMHSGLSDNCVNDVLVDSRNFLWVGTNAGVDFYDGYNTVDVSFRDADNNVQPVVFSLAEDASGIIWAGTSKGLYHIDKERLEMSRFDSPLLDGVPIRHMCCSSVGFLWITRKKNDIIRIDTSDGTISTFPIEGSALCNSPSGAVFIVSDEGRLYISPDGKSEPYILFSIPETDLNYSRIACAGGYIFLSVEKGLAYAFDLAKGDFIPLPLIERMRAAVAAPSGELWIGTRDGIHVLDSALVQKGIMRPFLDNSIRCLSQDRCGGIWAGTLFEGLAHIVPDKLRFRHYSDSFAGGRFKARDFAETPDGHIWIGSDTKGLLCLNPKEESGRTSRQFLSGRNITGLMAEGSKLWVGTIDNVIPVCLIDCM